MVTTVTDNSPQSINTSLFSLDKEVQEIKKTTDALNDKLSGINTEYGVISVNGKQGIVELTASDVDALPSSTVIPTTTSELENTSGFITINDAGSSFVPITRKINNKQLNTDITLTASDVGALPDTTVIPTKTSQLTNDNGFITSSDSITGNAATATTAETATTANHAETATTADKAVDVVDYNDTSKTLRIGFAGPGVTADKLLYLAGYTRDNSSSVKLKDVNKEELIKWLGIPRVKYADYQIPEQTFTQFQQVPIELSKFSPEVTPNKVLCFMVIYWSRVHLIASGDWGAAVSTGLKCSLIALGAGTGYAIIRCVYMV